MAAAPRTIAADATVGASFVAAAKPDVTTLALDPIDLLRSGGSGADATSNFDLRIRMLMTAGDKVGLFTVMLRFSWSNKAVTVAIAG